MASPLISTGDGDNDALASLSTGEIVWFNNVSGNGAFGTKTLAATVTAPPNDTGILCVADINKDGDLDIITGSPGDDKILFMENADGIGTFSGPVEVAAADGGGYRIFVAAADMDNDGDMDILSASYGDDTIAWHENPYGEGSTWTSYDITNLSGFTADGAWCAQAVDLDADGDLDVLAASNWDANGIVWFENVTGDGKTWTGKTITTSVDRSRFVNTADMDDDGDIDVLSASWGDDKIAWYANSGTGDFGAQQIISVNADGPQYVYAADFDNDGDLDAVSAGSSQASVLNWYENMNGVGSAWTTHEVDTEYTHFVYTSDLNGDNHIDLLSGMTTNNLVTWYENLSPDVADTTPPQVQNTDPADGTTDVPIDTTVIANFSEAVDPASVTDTTFTVKNTTATITGTIVVNDAAVTFTPDTPLAWGTVYTATLFTGITDMAGNALETNYQWSFTTPVNDPPGVTGTSPLDNATDVDINDLIKADFSEPMDASTLTPDSFFISDGTANIDGNISYSDSTIIFTPAAGAIQYNGTTYTATITTAATDTTGRGLQSDYTWSFTTMDNNPPVPPVSEGPADESTFTEGDDVLLTASPFDDPENDDHVTSYWEVRRADNHEVVKTHTSAGADNLTALTVPNTYLTEGLKYTWQVRYDDNYGNEAWSEASSFKVGTSVEDATVQVEAGTDTVCYRMVSFVQYPDDPDAETVLGDDLATEYLENYKIGTYDAINGAYIEYGNGLAIEPGYAYWILARNGLNPSVEGIPVSLDADIHVMLCYNETTGDGWNMIGCPNEADYLWDEVEVFCYDADGDTMIFMGAIGDLAEDNPYIDKKLWRWENGSYFSDTAIIKAYEGYWVKAKQAGVYLRYNHLTQIAKATSFEMKLAGFFTELKSMARSVHLIPEEAIAADGQTPPMPMGAIGESSSGGGCFVQTLTR